MSSGRVFCLMSRTHCGISSRNYRSQEQLALLAHCVSLGVNALFEPVKGYDGRISAHGIAQRIKAADALANVVGLDMAEAGWTATADNYLGRVTKPRIIEAVREAKGDTTVALIETS